MLLPLLRNLGQAGSDTPGPAFVATRSVQANTTGSTSLSVDVSGVRDGKVSLIWVVAVGGATVDPGAITLTGAAVDPVKHAEWTEAAGPAARIAVFWWVGDGSTPALTAGWTTSGRAVAHVLEYDGVDVETPLWGGAGADTTGGASSSVSTGSLASLNRKFWPVAGFYSRTTTVGQENTTFTAPAGFTERSDSNNSGAGSSPWVGLSVADKGSAVGDEAAHSYTATAAFSSGHAGGLLVYLVGTSSGPTITSAAAQPFASGSLMRLQGFNFGLTGGTAVLTASASDHTTGAVSQGGVYIWDDGNAWILCDTTGLSDGTYYVHLNSFVSGWSGSGFPVQVITGVSVSLRSLWLPNDWAAGGTPSTFTLWENTDTVIVFGFTENQTTTLATPTVSGLTFSLVTSIVVGGEAVLYVWKATAASAGSGNVTATRTGTGQSALASWVVQSSSALTVTALTANNSEAAYSPTVAAGNMVIHALVDFLASLPAKTPLAGSGTATERIDTNTTQYGIWAADWMKTAAGTFSFGPNNYTSLQVAQGGVVLSVAAGGTTFPVALAGSVAISGALAKRPGKSLAGVVVSAGALAKRPGRSLSGAVAISGALTRSSQKPLGGSVASSGALSLTKVAIRAFAGSVASSGALTRRPGKALAGSVASSGAVTRSAGKALAGSVGSSGALTKRAARALAGAVAISGALTRQVGKPVAGSVGSSGALARSAGKALAGSVASAGVLTRSMGKALAGSVSSSGALSTLRLIVKSLAGSVSIAGAVTRQTRKPLSGAIIIAGTLTRSAQKALGGSVSPSGALTRVKVALISLSGSVGLSGALTKVVGKPMAGSVASSGSLTRQVRKALAGVVALSGALSVTKVAIRAFAGAVSISGVLTRRTGKSVAGSVTSSGSLTRQARKALAGAVAISGAASLTRTVARAFAGTVTISGTVTKRAQKSLGGVVASSGTVTKLVRIGLAGAVDPQGALVKRIGRLFSGAVDALGSLSTSTSSQPTNARPGATGWEFGPVDRWEFGRMETVARWRDLFGFGRMLGAEPGRSDDLRFTDEEDQ